MSTDLVDLMERATATLPVETARLVNGGLRRGAAQVRRRRRRTALLTSGVAAAAMATALAVPGITGDQRTAGDVGSGGLSAQPTSATLRLLSEDELSRRFAASLPGTFTELSVEIFEGTEGASVEGVLTGADGAEGNVLGGFAVFDPLPADAVRQSKASCREAQTKVGPRDGTDCVLVPGGMVQIWDDTVEPEDPAGLAPGIRMSWVSYTRWDGANATLRALNSTSSSATPAAGAVPVVRTAELVELVQQLEWYAPR